MTAGELRHRIALLPPNTAPDAWTANQLVPDSLEPAGGKSVRRVWASVKAASGKKSSNNDGVQSGTTYEIKIRFQPNITPGWRIAWAGKFLDVLEVLDKEGLSRELNITAIYYDAQQN